METPQFVKTQTTVETRPDRGLCGDYERFSGLVFRGLLLACNQHQCQFGRKATAAADKRRWKAGRFPATVPLATDLSASGVNWRAGDFVNPEWRRSGSRSLVKIRCCCAAGNVAKSDRRHFCLEASCRAVMAVLE
jgi:hypothetical protein